MTERKMTKAETSAWLVGQYVMADALIQRLEEGATMEETLEECLRQITEPARANDQIHLMFLIMNLRSRLREVTQKQVA